jgi:hypothetical protein
MAYAIMLAASCAAPKALDPRDGAVPPGIDLSGNWRLQNDQGAGQRQLREAIRKTDGVKDDEILRQRERQSTTRGSRDGRVRGGLVYVFLEIGEALKVTQTAHGIFISFDRAVVEEFRFGENRLVSVGEVQAQRVTGWEGDTLVVDTLDRSRMKLTERFRLMANGQMLERRITLRSKSGEEETVVQRFDRDVQ